MAEYVAANLHVNLARAEECNDLQLALREAFLSTNQRYFIMQEETEAFDGAGATAVLAVLQREFLTVAWAGDSEAVLFRSDGSFVACCPPHKPNQVRERTRIEDNGGQVVERNGVWRINGQLAVARAFGDYKVKKNTGKKE